MSNSLKSVAEISKSIPALGEWLVGAERYLAHTHSAKESEKFAAHVMLVDSYFMQLCQVHGLDSIIDKLITAVVELNFQESERATLAQTLKVLFVQAIHFHDFGKVNENFQADPKKMNNPLFKVVPDNLLGSSHSALGAYLFVVTQMNETVPPKMNLSNEAWTKLNTLILLFSYCIFKHHAPELAEPVAGEISFKEEVKAMKEYLKLYQFKVHPGLEEKMPPMWQKQYFDRFDKILKVEFPLFALLKLQFSLLTGADYLATHEYMADTPTTDFGVFSSRERITKITANLRFYKHNKATFDSLAAFQFEHPTEKSFSNLNQLRTEMAVELIQSVRRHPEKNLYYIEAPTGGGKTNLSMITVTELLEQNPSLTKFYYVFPFTTLITQTYKALQETLGLQPHELVQLHAKAAFQSKEEASKDGEYGNEKKDFIDNLFALYPVTVLSHVKFFDILKSNRKEVNYLLHRIANSVVIIDELQSYNPAIWDKMLYFISQYAECFNIKFVLMSATLPKISALNIGLFHQPHFTDLLPNAKRYLQNPNFAERVTFRFDLFDQEITQESLAAFVLQKSEVYAAFNQKHASVHTIVEFIYKKSASEFQQHIHNQPHFFDEVFVLSGTILEPRRKFIINFLKNPNNRSKNILLITTQVVEAGVDIDMDLGFKNVSLVDSDEQLAGRVNRNADKATSEVYLFKLDDAKVLYKADERFKVTRDKEKLNQEQYERVLREKDFEYLYNEVFLNLNNKNALPYADNFKGDILSPLKRLSFREINANFKIIDQQSASVFVPVALGVSIGDEASGTTEAVFTGEELRFLERHGSFSFTDAEVAGRKVWELYVSLIQNQSKGFHIKEKVNFKILQSIMAKFTFSLVSFSKMIPRLKEFCLNADLTYGYYYLLHHDQVYSEEAGLLENQFDAVENYFL
ncbi:CRISPR-associated helicase Cas3' [Rufibacter quisquiliarum]|uniref:CRISPR-associated endonuclease/helicase Cas3 n=1 Tax=Rufibacter quisquiliarum TaxID=1549639 RepID=A0A839G9T3_9BACT|nr:CRISPR-associated helicase Cas3' [Rufibacter quisquiliarum]MBA9075712.1 CRISPR-associated endonuclease/helicase Cas3 [Rufibacter quisquiliarum]